MKKQSEAEWMAEFIDDGIECLAQTDDSSADTTEGKYIAPTLLAALKRRDWTPPKKGKGKK